MRLYTYEKLLFTCTRILKVLSACPNNKMEIVKVRTLECHSSLDLLEDRGLAGLGSACVCVRWCG